MVHTDDSVAIKVDLGNGPFVGIFTNSEQHHFGNIICLFAEN